MNVGTLPERASTRTSDLEPAQRPAIGRYPTMTWRCARCQHEKETQRLAEPPKWGDPDAKPFGVLLFEHGDDFIITCERHLTVIVRAPLGAMQIENLSRVAM